MFLKKKNKDDNNFLTNVGALLIHAAKIDENYTDNEQKIIKRTLEELGLEKVDFTEAILQRIR